MKRVKNRGVSHGLRHTNLHHLVALRPTNLVLQCRTHPKGSATASVFHVCMARHPQDTCLDVQCSTIPTPLPHAGDAGGQHRVADNER